MSFQDGKPLDVVCNKITERRGTSDSDCKIVEMENTNKESLEVECSGILPCCSSPKMGPYFFFAI